MISKERNTLMRKVFLLCQRTFLIAPFVFVIVFFGIFPMRFDAVVYTDNIVGEGSCTTYLSSENESFAYLYKGDAYFGSELKTLRLPKLRYDISEVKLYIYDVEEADIVSFDITVFGWIVSHVSSEGLLHPFVRDNIDQGITTNEVPLIHVVPDDPAEATLIALTGFKFIPIWVWIIYFIIIAIISVILSCCFGLLFKKHPLITVQLSGGAAIMVALIMGCFFCGSCPYVNYTAFLLNWTILFMVALILNALFSPWVGSILVSLATLFWYIANFYVISFRSKPIMPPDLRAAGTAFEVARGYNLKPTWQMVLGILVVFAYCAGTIFCYYRRRKEITNRAKHRYIVKAGMISMAAVVIAFVLNSHTFASLNTFQWDAKVLEAFHREGPVLTFVKSLISGHVRRPEGYSRDVVQEYLLEYGDTSQNEKNSIKPTRIIMIMNEAFSDLRSVGMDDRIDVMPFIDSLSDNTIKGNLYSSVFAGGTCNTEFEALTGNSLAFLGVGAYPYTENVLEPLFSLASYLRNSGYSTEAFHANDGKNWNRSMVYPYLGFEMFHDIKDYPKLTDETTLHGHPADIADYLFMKSVDENYDEQPHFLFNVTMQNHSGYDHFEDVIEDESVSKYGAELKTEPRVYLSLIRASDDAIKQLVDTYKDSDDPTMIVFFGDHQPGLTTSEQSGIYNNVNYHLDYFKTKFFIWTNYESSSEEDVFISANYLPLLVLEQGNFPLPPYVQMLKEVHEKYPVISSQGVIDSDGNVYDNVAVLMDDPLIKKYQYIQYANLFDEIDPVWFDIQ